MMVTPSSEMQSALLSRHWTESCQNIISKPLAKWNLRTLGRQLPARFVRLDGVGDQPYWPGSNVKIREFQAWVCRAP